MIDYIFHLSNGTDLQVAHPNWKDDLSIDYAYENNQKFMRADLSGQLTFMNEDYTWILSQGIETKIYITIYVSFDGGTAQMAWSGMFHLTDCTINVDDKILKVKPQKNDVYNAILAGLDKEYDLIKLVPPVQPVQMTRRPMLQIYAAGENIVSCFLSSMAWEQEVTEMNATDEEIQDDYHFGKIGGFVEIMCDSQAAGLTNPFIGQWDHGSVDGQWQDFQNGQGVFRIDYYQLKEETEDPQQFRFKNGLRIYAVDGSTVYWQFEQVVTQLYSKDFKPIPTNITFQPVNSYGTINATTSDTPFYGRFCTARKLSGGYNIPKGDLVAYNRNYQYCQRFSYNGAVVMSYDYSDTPTPYGLRPDGKYYKKPAATLQNLNYYPVGRTTWGMASKWFVVSAATIQLEYNGRVEHTLRDAYTLEAVISALLAQVAPSVTFGADAAYSQFLYGTNTVYPYMGRLVLTPKSNVLVAEYTQPAQKALTTLGTVLAMLRDALGCYWFVDSSNRLRIEHISWFKNGGSYIGSPVVGIDVTKMMVTRNGRPWTLGTAEYSYDKVDMPERYQYRWMDETTDVFKGDPVEIRSTFVNEGDVEEISINGFNSDVDYMMLNPSNVSSEGFALLCCTVNGGVYTVPVGSDILDGAPVSIQNYLVAFRGLIPGCLVYDMPSWNINVNGSDANAKGIQRKKKQEIKVPMGSSVPDFSKLVKTTLGDGFIEKAGINLSSRMVKMELAFDTVANASPTPTPTPTPTPEPTPTPGSDPELFTEIYGSIKSLLDYKMSGTLPASGSTHDYLLNMYNYATANANTFYDQEIFGLARVQTPPLRTDRERGERAQMAWLMAMCMVEICPNVQNDLYNIGFSIVGNADEQRVFGYNYFSDVNIARLVASVLYAMHRPDVSSLEAAARTEIAGQDGGGVLGTTRGSSIPTEYDDTTAAVAEGTSFMPTAPKNDPSNLDFAFDESTWDYVTSLYTYTNGAYSNSRAEQAVDDNYITTVALMKDMYEDVGVNMSQEQEDLITPCYMWGSRIVSPMKDGFDSVTQQWYPGSGDEPRTDVEFRMRPFEYHDVHLLDPNDDGSDYLNTSSYPSGHASFGWNIALIFIETHRNSLQDVKTIMARAFQFGQSRVIGRYHWQEDVLYGYVIGSCCIARLHAYNEYLTLLADA